MSTTARYPARAAPALGYLKAHSNDVDIFVEDTSSPNMWLKIIRRYLPKTTKIKSVSPLGGKKEVLKACRADQAERTRRRLYIIDADMDLLTGSRKPGLKHLYRLQRYCIENYLIDQTALRNVVTGLLPKISEDEVDICCDVKAWLSRNSGPLRSLFEAYAISEHLYTGYATVSYSCYRLFNEDGSFDLCPRKVRSRVFRVLLAARRQHSGEEVRRARETIKLNISKRRPIEYCSGKHYIIPGIFETLKSGIKITASLDVFKTMLADHVNTDADPHLKRRLALL